MEGYYSLSHSSCVGRLFWTKAYTDYCKPSLNAPDLSRSWTKLSLATDRAVTCGLQYEYGNLGEDI